MLVLFRIAFRNLWQHKGKSLIIGLIMAIGVIVLIVGNSFMDTAQAGLRKTFIDNYTGDVFISGVAEGQISLFGTQSAVGIEATPIIPKYEEVRKKIDADKEVLGYTGQLSGFASLTVDEDAVSVVVEDATKVEATDSSTKEPDKAEVATGQDMSFTLLFGVEPESYAKLFSSVKIVEGRFLENGEEGLLINKKRLEDFNKAKKTSFKTGDTMLLNGYGATGFKIRAVPIVGVFEFKADAEGVNMISYCDLNTLRALNSLTVGGDEDYVPSDAEKALLSVTNTDDLFSGDVDLIADSSSFIATSSSSDEETPYVKAVIDDGAYHYIVLKLKNPALTNAYIASINTWFTEQGIQAKAGDWKAAAGPYGVSVDVFRVIFNIAVIIVAIVAIIIIMNTLIVSIIERTGEIGTMRALGAHKSFVWRMFLTETFTISFVFGLIGTFIALCGIFVLNMLNIKADNQFLEIIFGGKILHVDVNMASVISTMILMIFVGFISHIYPVLVALKIQPVQAMQTE